MVQGHGLDSGAVRARMVQKLAAQGVSDAAVLAAMGSVERHRLLNAACQFVIVQRLFEKVEGAFFEGGDGQRNVAVAGQEYDR